LKDDFFNDKATGHTRAHCMDGYGQTAQPSLTSQESRLFAELSRMSLQQKDDYLIACGVPQLGRDFS
jgi:hypothetical protein